MASCGSEGAQMATCRVLDVLIEGTVVGTTYRKLLCYDLSGVASLRSLKTRVLGDLKAAGAPIEGDCEVVLRNYHISNYDTVGCNSDVARSCTLGDPAARWPVGKSGCSRLVAAAPCPRLPLDTADQGRDAVFAIASRQFYDRLRGGSAVLPLEARVKPSLQPTVQASEGDIVARPSATSSSGSAWLASPVFDPLPFNITVRDFRGRSHSVRVSGATSVQRLKQGIATALGCSVVSHWRLYHKGRPLVETLDLDDYNITAGSVVDVQMTSQQNAVISRSKDNLAGGIRTGLEAGGGGASSTGSGPGASHPTSGASGSSASSSQPSGSGDKGSGSQVVVQVLLPCGRLLSVPRGAMEEASQFLQRILDEQEESKRPRTEVSSPSSCSSSSVGWKDSSHVSRPGSAVEGLAVTAAAAVAAEAEVEAAAKEQPEAEASPTAKVKENAEAELEVQTSVTPPQEREARAAAAVRVERAELPPEVMAAAVAALGSRSRWPVARDSGNSGRRRAGELKDVMGQKLFAILLAAAAVVMAMAML